uniref:glutathione transferase n=1 Tax=Balaenoptera musculus TaxID=9771 RepID=A0A8C0DMK4_BALMU
MVAKPKLCYIHGRGRIESISWLLAAAGVEFEEEFLETREQYVKLQKNGCLLFRQVHLVEIDRMVLTQTRAILSYLAAKYNLHGKDLKGTLRYQSVRAYTGFLAKLCGPAPTETQLRCKENPALIVKKAKTRHFPVFEKVESDLFFLITRQHCLFPDVLPILRPLSMIPATARPYLAFKTRISNIPTIKTFLQPGSQRKLPPG